LLSREQAQWEDDDCLYWDAVEVNFDPDRMQLIKEWSLFTEGRMQIVYIRPKLGHSIPEEGATIQLLKRYDASKKDERRKKTTTHNQIAFAFPARVVKRYNDMTGNPSKLERKTECAVIEWE
jgi:hypothetical protein